MEVTSDDVMNYMKKLISASELWDKDWSDTEKKIAADEAIEALMKLFLELKK